MKICFVNQDMSIGGSSTVLHDLILNWPNIKDELYLIVFFDNFDNRYYKLLNKKNLKIYFLHKTKKIDLKFLKLLKKTLFQIKPDVISSHLTTTFYLKFVGAEKICNIYHTVHSEPNKDLPFLYRLYLNKSIKQNTIKLIGVCDYISKKAETLYNVKVITIRNGIDINHLYFKNKHNKINFIFVGRLVSIKNVKKIINAFNELNNRSSILRIVGDGKLKKNIVHLIKKTNNQNIFFVGKTNNVDFYLKQSDVLCLVSEREGMPITILEAIKYDLSFIVSNVGGISEIIKNNINGIVINSITVNTIKNSMEKMLNRECLNKYKKNNIKLKNVVSASDMALNYKKILN